MKMPYIKHQAAGRIGKTRAQKLVRGFKYLGVQSHGFQKSFNRVTDGRVIVDNKNRGVGFIHVDLTRLSAM